MAGSALGIFGPPRHIGPVEHGPAGFCWLIPGLLGGTPRPGRSDLQSDVLALKKLHIKLLVSLTGEWQPDTEVLRRADIASLYAPIADFGTPSFALAQETCAQVAAFTARGEAVVFHCQAGKGRTGTMLAAMLIWAGATADAAIAGTRAHNPAWIETDGQLVFLQAFDAHLAKNGRD